MGKIKIDLEIDAELFQWFEEYCEDGLLDLDEELSALVAQYIQEQLEEEGDLADPEPKFEEAEVLAQYDEDYDEEYLDEEETV